jgi:NAD+ kinase
MNRVPIYGGSFNPPGLHHRQIAEAVSDFFGNLFVAPCGVRQDKMSTAEVENSSRAILVGFAFDGLEKVDIDYDDLYDDAFTPTWEMDKKYSSLGEVWHVVGPDLIKDGSEARSEIHRVWQKGSEIWQNLNFAVIKPAGCQLDEKDLPPHNLVIPMPAICGRSKQIRKLIATGEPFEHLVMPDVAEYIKAYNLYGYIN